MSEKISVKDIAEHIIKEQLTCACKRASFAIPSKDGEAMIMNFLVDIDGRKTAVGPFTSITCPHCGEVKLLYVPTVLRAKELREKWDEKVNKPHPDSQIEPSEVEAEVDSRKDRHP